jgi:hypothetical protein
MEVEWNKNSKIDLETKKEGSNPYSVAYIKPGRGAPRGRTQDTI